MSVLVSDRQKLTRDEVDEGFHLLAELDRLRRHQGERDHGLKGVGIFTHDAEAVAAIMPAYAAEVSRRITQATDRLAALGIDAAPVPTARNGGTVVLRAGAPGQATIADVVSQGERVAAVVLEQMKRRG